MTTVSVQPTTSEQNEREAFRKWWEKFKYTHPDWIYTDSDKLAFEAWQHQQKLIDKLESCNLELQFQNNLFMKDIESLQAQLTVAVKGLETYAEGERYMISPNVATEALAEIKRIGG